MKKSQARKAISVTTVYLTSVLIASFSLIPLVLTFVTSMKTYDELYVIPPRVLPSKIYLDNYLIAVGLKSTATFIGSLGIGQKFPTYMANSVLVSSMSTMISVALGIVCAYGLSRFKFRGRGAVSMFVLWAYLLPQVVFLVPFYIIFKETHIIGTFLSLIVSYQILSLPLCVWFLRAYFLQTPWELEEAAMVDGCTRFGAFVRVLLRMLFPAILAVALLGFVQAWGEYLFALVYTSEVSKTAPIGIYMFMTESGTDWGGLMAATLIYSAPVAVMFMIMQRYFITGLTSGALKA